ncbi:MAG: 3-keto-5-aminohexanoate cleavage protein [Alphaproteobacteria bacterium]|nr:3-keto-5-aminohexanoate cleavage protein [Alphaproteobacteria bacterium]
MQHILYDKTDLLNLISLRDQNILPHGQLDLLFVLGRYGEMHGSNPHDFQVFINVLSTHNVQADWMVCAFGVNEIDCLLAAHKLGGKMRIGFENSLWNQDGSLATSNEQRVTDLLKEIK